MQRKAFIIPLLVFVVLLNASLGSAQKPRVLDEAPPPPPRPMPTPARPLGAAETFPEPLGLNPEQQKRYDSFRTVWTTIKDNYFDATFNGLNWNTIRREYQPRILKATNSYEFHSILQEMINRLNRSHFVIIPPEVFEAVEKTKEKIKENEADKGDGKTDDKDDDEFSLIDDESKYGIGIEIRILNDQIVITHVAKDSTGEKAGLRPGFVIDKINEVSLKTMAAAFAQAGAYGKLAEKMFPVEILNFFVNGDSDSEVLIGYLDEKDVAKSVSVKREKIVGTMVKATPDFPAELFTFESYSIDENTGYIKFNMFAMPAVDVVCRALMDFKDKKAVIVDMRGNLGGSIGAMIGITGMLIDKPLSLGTQIYRRSSDVVAVRPQGRMYGGRLIVLVDSMSHSAAEIFAGGLQESGRLTVVGEKSAGQALPSTTLRLATGALFLYPFANFKTPKGYAIEGNGVTPDIKIARERASLLTGKDAQLEAALNLISAPPVSAKDKIASGKIDMPSSSDLKLATKLKPPAILNAPKIPEKYDPQAIRIIDEFVAAVGGATAVAKLTSYTARGNMELTRAGTRINGSVEIFNRSPDRIAEKLTVEAIGSITSLFDGKKIMLLSDIMGNSETTDPRQVNEMNLLADLHEMIKVRDLYRQVTYLGEYERKGKMALMVKGVTAGGSEIAFVFDPKTKYLLHRVGGGIDIAYDDYRKVGDLMMPHWQTRTESLVLKLSEFKLNVPLEDSIFIPKDNCFTLQDKIGKEEKE